MYNADHDCEYWSGFAEKWVVLFTDYPCLMMYYVSAEKFSLPHIYPVDTCMVGTENVIGLLLRLLF